MKAYFCVCVIYSVPSFILQNLTVPKTVCIDFLSMLTAFP